MAAGDIDALIDFPSKAPAGRLAHPRTEHFAPLFVALGAALDDSNTVKEQRAVIDGFWYGLSKRSYESPRGTSPGKTGRRRSDRSKCALPRDVARIAR